MPAIDATTRLSSTRRALVALAAAVALLATAFVTEARAEGGTLKAWGPDNFGQLDGTATPFVATPTAVPGVDGVVQVVAGGSHTLALRADGTVLAWGNDSNGQLGDNTARVTPTAPFTIEGLSSVVELAAGSQFSLALRADGTVLAWGDNTLGQLGIESPREEKPREIPGLTGVVAIAAAQSHSAALLADGTVLGWGSDMHGESSGSGQAGTTVPAPLPVPGVSGAVGIATGGEATLALLADGSVLAWGANRAGQLGTGAATETGCECLPPTVAPALAGATQLSGGNSHGLGAFPGGAGKAWGLDVFGQLGDGRTLSSGCDCEPVPVAISTAPRLIRSVDAGGGHSLALLDDGTVLAWGENSKHQVSPGAEATISTPFQVEVTGATEVSAGSGLSSVAEGASFALVGPSQALAVHFAGAGRGTVAATRGLRCSEACEGRFPQGQTEVLLPRPAAGAFAGFSGPCTGTGSCQVKLASDQVVTATFGAAAGTKLTRSRVNRKRRTASFAFTAPGAITGFECELVRPRASGRKRPLARFSACASGKTFKRLTPGAYVFQVRARDSVGADAHPAVSRFRIPAPRHRSHAHRR